MSLYFYKNNGLITCQLLDFIVQFCARNACHIISGLLDSSNKSLMFISLLIVL